MAKLKKEKKVNEFPSPYTFTNAVKKGDIITKLSMLIMGAGNIAHQQIIKGLIFLGIEIA